MNDSECDAILIKSTAHLIKCCFDDFTLGLISLGNALKGIKENKTLLESMEGTIHKDEHGNRYIFRDGLWHGMCTLEPLSFDYGYYSDDKSGKELLKPKRLNCSGRLRR